MSSPPVTPTRSVAARLFACSLVWAQLAPLAQATDIGDVPMATKSRTKPNLMFVIDDSGSMDWEWLGKTGFATNDGALWWHTGDRRFFGRDRANDSNASSTPPGFSAGTAPGTPPTGPINFALAGAPDATWKKYQYLFPNGRCTGLDYTGASQAGWNCESKVDPDDASYGLAVPPTREFAWTRSSVYNAVYYNPAVNYDPWRPYHDGTALRTPVNYNNSGTGLWTAVRSHPHYPTPTTTGEVINLTIDRPLPGDTTSTDRTYRMYAGMLLPASSRYRVCTSANNSTCGAWVTAGASDVCIRRTATDTVNQTCLMAPFYGVTTALDIGGTADAHLDVQIAFYPSTYWQLSTATGALAANEAWGIDGRRLIRTEIRSSTTSYPRAIARTDCAGATCTYAEEMTNFANWYAYYRKRTLMLAAALGLALDQVKGMRGGFFTLNNLIDVTMYDFDNASDASNGRRLLGGMILPKVPKGTPTRSALNWAGKQYQRTGGTAPINAACQFNGALVITDGFAAPEVISPALGNVDGASNIRFNVPYVTTDPALNFTTATPPGVIPVVPAPPSVPVAPPTASVTPAAPFTDPHSDTLADIAMYYYSNNLRPDLTIRQVPVDQNDLAVDADRQDYLHMNTYAIGLGVEGFTYNQTSTTALINSNLDPYAYPPDWTNGGVNPNTVSRSPAAVDELWHATINGRGQMLSAGSPEETRAGVVDIVNNVGAKAGAGAAVSVANPNLTPGDNFAYASSYNSGAWSGDINKFAIDLTTGFQSTIPAWDPSPQKQLANREISPTDTNRRTIITYDGTNGQPFQWASLSTAQRSSLNNDTEVLNFLRGDRTREVEKFRSRGPRPPYKNGITPNNISVLGSVINAEPVVVGPPVLRYFDQDYATFRTSNASRATVVYQGANDGMLHAFAGTNGAESWAYVPTFVYPNLLNLSDRNAFAHRYTVDGTPNFNDVDLGFTGAPPPASWTSDWRTLLVGSLRKGGFGYYALDITNASVSSEATMTSRVLWEFPKATTPAADRLNMGYSFGRPIIVKTRAAGWVVIVSSGYNNGTSTGDSGGDGQGRIWILNARTGDIIRSISTGAGTPSLPSGLAHLSAFVERPDVDALVEAVYGGDLLGNLWRFDLSGTTTASWAVSKLATLVDGSGNIQPITTEPELGLVNRKRVVYVGAGQYLGDSDVPGATSPNVFATRKMSFYGIRDDLSVPTFPNAVVTPLRSNLVAQTITKNVAAGTANVSTNAVDLATKAGWYMDFTDNGERSVTNPVLSGGVLSFTTNIPAQVDPCIPGGSSWTWFIDYANGGKVVNSSTASGISMGNTLSSRVVLVRLPNGDIIGLVRGSDTITRRVDPPNNVDLTTGRRMSWREIVQ